MKKPTIRLIALNLVIALLFSLCAPVLAVSNLIPGTIYIDGPAGTETRFTYTPTARWHDVGGGTPITLRLYKDGEMLYEMHERQPRWIQMEPGSTYELVCINEYDGTNCFGFLAYEDIGTDSVVDSRGDYCFTPEETAYYQFLIEDGSVYPWADVYDRSTGASVKSEDEKFFLHKDVDYTFSWYAEYSVQITKVMSNELSCTQSSYEAGTYLFKPEESGYYSFSDMPKADLPYCAILNGSYVYYLDAGESYRFRLDDPFAFAKLAQPLALALGSNLLSTYNAPGLEGSFTPQESGCYSFFVSAGTLRLYDGDECVALRTSRDTAFASLTAHRTYNVRMEQLEELDIEISKEEDPLTLQDGTIEQNGMYIPKATGVYLLTGICTVENLSKPGCPCIFGDITTYAYLFDNQVYKIYDIPNNGAVNVRYLGEAEEIYADGIEKPAGFYWFTPERNGFYRLNAYGNEIWDTRPLWDYSNFPPYALEAGETYLVCAEKEVSIVGQEEFLYRELPDGTLTIEGFLDAQSNIVIPKTIEGKTVSAIDQFAKFGNSSAEIISITIPATVTSIDPDIFIMGNIKTLQAVYVSENNPVYASDQGVLYNKEKTLLIGCPTGKTGEYVIPERVTQIANNAFMRCKELTKVILPEGLQTIGSFAFEHCENLKQISLPKSLTKIGNYAFCNCSALGEIEIPESVEMIGGSAFYGCTGLTDVTISEGVKEIGSYAFNGCFALTEVTIPDGVTTIERYTFSYCVGLKQVRIPHGVTKIEEGAFLYCNNLKYVTIPASVTQIGDNAFFANSGHYHFLGDLPVLGDEAFDRNVTDLRLYYLEGANGWENCDPNYQTEVWNYTLTTDCTHFIYTCAICADTYYKADDDAHAWYLTDEIAVLPTCTQEGIGTYCCADCGKMKSDSIPALGHVPGEETVEKEPTCTEEGTLVAYCSVCGEPVRRNVPPTGHEQGELIQETDTYWEYACLNGDHTFIVEKDPRLQVVTLNGVRVQIEDGSEYPWVLSKNTEYEGGTALISTNQGVGNSESVIRFVFSAEQQFTISCTCWASSEQSYDYLSVFSDEISLGSISGEENFIYETGVLSPGTHTLEFNYYKDGSVDTGNDTAYILNIVAEVYEGGCTHSALYGVEEYAPTCTDPGSISYWYCEDCQCYFSDGEAQNEIPYDATIVPALGLSHNYCYYSDLGEKHLVACCNCGDSYQENHTFTLGECICGNIPDSPEIPDGYVAIYNPIYGKAMTTVAYSTWQSSNGTTYTRILPTDATEVEGKLVSDSLSLALVKVITNEGGITSFQTADGKYLEASRYALQFVDEPNVNTEFVLEPAGEGYFVRLANDFTYGDYSYLEYYQGSLLGTEYFTSYHKGNSGDMFLMTFLEVAEGPACDHVWVEQETHLPTCRNDGYKISACTLCDGTFPEVITALGHVYIYTDNGDHHTVLCSRCGEGHAEEHSYEDGRCIYCGKSPVDVPEGYVAIYCPGYGLAVTTTINARGYLASAAATIEDGKLVTESADVALVKVLTDDRGITSFQLEDGRYLEAGYPDLGGYPCISFADTPNEYTEFILDPVEGGYYIRLANYLYNGTKPQYIEYYPGRDVFTIYGMGSNAAQYVYNFYEAHIHTWDKEVTVPANGWLHGEKTVTCTGCGKSKTEIIPAEPTPGEWVIAAKVGDTYYAMSNTFDSKNEAVEIPVVNGMVSASDAEGLAVSLSQTEEGWTISSGDTYLTYATGINFGASAEPYYWQVTEGINGSWRILIGVEGNRALIYRGGSYHQFGPYVVGYATAGSQEYYDVEVLPIAREEKPIVDEGITINHTLNLASDISVNFAVKTGLVKDYANHYMVVEIPVYEGDAQIGIRTVTIDPVEKEGYYYYTLTGLTAVNMGDVVSAQLHMEKDGIAYVSKVDTYSVAQYAYAQLDKAKAPLSLKALCADLLRYGKETQVFKSYRMDALVDAAMTDTHKSYLSDAEAVTFHNVNEILTDLESPVIAWEGKALNLDSKVSVKYIFSLGTYGGKVEELTLKVNYVNCGGQTTEVILRNPELYSDERGFYAFTFDGLLVAELRSVTEVAVYHGETRLSQTLRYSPDTYGNNKKGQLLRLCKALIAYSDTAKTFFN